jgi:hypothetical protein
MNDIGREMPHSTAYKSRQSVGSDIARGEHFICSLALCRSGHDTADDSCARSSDRVTQHRTSEKRSAARGHGQTTRDSTTQRIGSYFSPSDVTQVPAV